MPLETVRFDRVFGTTKTSQNRMPVTLFGFQSGDHIEYSVAAPGEPCMETGNEAGGFSQRCETGRVTT